MKIADRQSHAVMARLKIRRWMLGVITAVAVLVVAGVGTMHFAARSLKQGILEALGPESEVADLSVGFSSIVITGIRVKAPRGWPADSTLRAARVVVVPDIRQLLTRHIYVTSVQFENAYISAVRPKEGGGLQVLPSMLGESKKRKAASSGRTADIATVELSNCVLELFDATIAGHQKMHVDGVHGTLKDVKVPSLEGLTKVDLQGTIKGSSHQGRIAVAGWIDVAAKSSETATQVRNVDLVLFQPYLIQKTKAGIDQGTFNLDLKASVRNNVLTAPGKLTLNGLKLRTGDGPFSGLSNIPRRAVLGALADKDDHITLEFELKGNLDNPTFSLSQGLGLRTGAALLQGLGLGFEGLIRAFFALVNGLAFGH